MDLNGILAEASCLITDMRQDQYGDYLENWERIGIVWGALLDIQPIEPEVVGLMMASMKICRAVTNLGLEDSYTDACAYIAGAGAIATSQSSSSSSSDSDS